MATDRELLEEINKNFATLAERVVNVCKELDEVREEVYGNNHKGLKADINDHLSRHDERQKLFKWLATIGGGGGIVGFITSLIAYFK